MWYLSTRPIIQIPILPIQVLLYQCQYCYTNAGITHTNTTITTLLPILDNVKQCNTVCIQCAHCSHKCACTKQCTMCKVRLWGGIQCATQSIVNYNELYNALHISDCRRRGEGCCKSCCKTFAALLQHTFCCIFAAKVAASLLQKLLHLCCKTCPRLLQLKPLLQKCCKSFESVVEPLYMSCTGTSYCTCALHVPGRRHLSRYYIF